MSTIRVGNRLIGDGQPCYIIAEIGINHNGDVDLAKRLISVAVAAGCDAVKFQKRTVDVVYTAEELAKPRENPFGDHQRRPEVRPGVRARTSTPRSTRSASRSRCPGSPPLGRGIGRLDHDNFNVPCLQDRFGLADRRQPAAPHPRHGQADHPLHRHEHLRRDRPRSRGAGQGRSDPAARLQHLPGQLRRAEPAAIPTMRERYGVPVGYSGHETGIPTSVARLALGACCGGAPHHPGPRHVGLRPGRLAGAQRHHAALVRDIRLWEQSMGDGVKRVYEREFPIIKKLRRVGATV